MLTAVVCRARNSAWCTGSAVCICSHVVYAPHLPPSTRTHEQDLGFTCGCIAPHLSTTPGPQRAVTDSPWEMKRAGKTLTGLRDTPWGAPSSGWWRSPWQRAGPRSRGHEPPREEVQACGEGRETLSLAAGRARLFLFSNEPSVSSSSQRHRAMGPAQIVGACRSAHAGLQLPKGQGGNWSQSRRSRRRERRGSGEECRGDEEKRGGAGRRGRFRPWAWPPGAHLPCPGPRGHTFCLRLTSQSKVHTKWGGGERGNKN